MTDAISALTSTAATSRSQESADKFDQEYTDFLSLLTTQLQNQDPTSPMDSTEFTNQIVQFTSVEQQIQTNQNLENLTSLMTSSVNADVTSYLGRDVVIDGGFGQLENGTLDWTYQMQPNVTAAGLAVFDQVGNQVASYDADTLVGQKSFTWDGMTTEGETAPEGIYELRVLAFDSEGNDINIPTQVKQRISEVSLTGYEPTFLAGGLQVTKSDILSVMLPEN
ncbi:flagellar hook capping FlgD N-terminal domain-containing protein [Temperatibacter marinus]|uniref:Basal-body rod modification protein FlgD n=1 Tax=Temperatibacter marinus TaxID=1456591 RepID=A0AA52EHR3_9PROT|nr:flagellar hook capping FlgD N-terminal domain-containing protein [Temperatibacter marinus]WND02734.1 flagellar hook capping FlgD N-terminal domain-containing protein [Temperatibacter marinus]